MQLHHIKSSRKKVSGKRVGRGGKRGTFSGRGSKGQKSRSGTRIRPGFRGGDNPIWKLFPKKRGSSKKTDITRALFQIHNIKPAIVKSADINKHFKNGDVISSAMLLEKKLIKTAKHGVKILGGVKLDKKVTFDKDITLSKSVREQI